MKPDIAPKTYIRNLAEKYASDLDSQIKNRIEEMKTDNKSHYLIYTVLGITDTEGEQIDRYQNVGRFLYKYAGSFLEDAAIYCLKSKFSEAKAKHRVPNTIGKRPATFEIDCLVQQNAYELKWRDATTDGDHITKEHTRLQAIRSHGFVPIRLMFFSPNRAQAIRIQETLKTLYAGMQGQYFAGNNAWKKLHELTDIDLKRILEELALGNRKKWIAK